jgi:hypothetical protein
LVSGQVYEAYLWDETDQSDYYHFTPHDSYNVQISLTNIPLNGDYDLYIYHYNPDFRLFTFSNHSGNVNEHVTFVPVAGRRYYVRVYSYKGFSSQQPYHLEVTYY